MVLFVMAPALRLLQLETPRRTTEDAAARVLDLDAECPSSSSSSRRAREEEDLLNQRVPRRMGLDGPIGALLERCSVWRWRSGTRRTELRGALRGGAGNTEESPAARCGVV